jgi:F-type H+-transporting ATPase subunit delta
MLRGRHLPKDQRVAIRADGVRGQARMNVRLRGTARRYARALLEVALEQDQAGALRDELRQAVGLLQEHPDLSAILLHPALAVERKQAIAREVFGRLGAGPLLARLLDLLITRGRMELLAEIEQAFTAAWNAQRGVVMAEAVTADALTQAQEERLAAALATASGQEVELATAVDPLVLGGVRVTMGGRIYDGTVRGRLQSLRRHLEGD